ncbi:hypothetical protein FPOA_09380 [Fusarium poae]|uniref:Zn(2)-C6 fungal-type domain-containing protein n=1 Tax=Fusarium poae TaxID=36050 RepID=A0A1B8AB02_FUSPO|nr:hypothetical protein FPOA_09380 [Fusarium poae]
MRLPVGPFDGRKKRSRCAACAKSHLKCSGNYPCNNCRKKQISCTFETQKPMKICIDYAESGDKIDATLDVSVTRSGPSSQMGMNLSNNHTQYLAKYFNTFLQNNIVNPRTNGFTDVVSLMKEEVVGGFLQHAVLSIGAMQAVKLNSFEGIDASKAYGLAFHRLPSSLHCVLWTTHLLGLFELMTDPSGAGWVQHLVHGTSKALVATGPRVCQSVIGQRFFTEIRVFEACRSIIFNEPTFLASPDWTLVGQQIQDKDQKDNHGLNELLNIIVSSSTLRVRVRGLLYPGDIQTPDHEGMDHGNAYDIVSEGFRLRQALIDCEASLPSPSSEKTNDFVVTNGFCLLAQAFISATSIYLSGVFDYEMPYWQDMGIAPPTLNEEEIQMHVSNILATTDVILGSSPISPLLVLFPLRVAGARSWQQWQQDHIMQCLLAVEMTFPVAAAFRADLHGLWAQRDNLI